MKTFYTSNYSRQGQHPNAVAISREPPPYYKGRCCDLLAPTWDMIQSFKKGSIAQDEYTGRYLNLLDSRNVTPSRIVEMFESNTIFLCYESPGDFCHRRIVAEWLNESNLAIVTELMGSIEHQKAVDDLLGYE